MKEETRKCGTCGHDIIVDRQNLNNIVYYQNRYHHLGCLVNKAEKGIESGKRISNWEKILNRIPEMQLEAKNKLCHHAIREKFNKYILDNYNIVSISKPFWETIEAVGNGNYKRKKCRPTDIDTIHGAWEWIQNDLNRIAAYNKLNNKGPQNDEQRLRYDLAIVLSKIPQYLAHIEKANSNIQEVRKSASFDTIDMSKIGQKKIEKKEDVGDIFDDLFS